MSLPEFDSAKLYLGKLCIHGHDWHGTGKSLRGKKKWECVQCKAERDRKYRSSHREKVVESKKRYYRANKDAHAANSKAYREANKEALKAYFRKYQQSNREQLNAYKLTWKRLNPDKVKASSNRYLISGKEARGRNLRRYRARKKQAHHAPYSIQDLKLRFQAFGDCCAYCQRELIGERVKQVDHFIPISKGGSDCLGNLVPACIGCNSGKCDRDPIEWFSVQRFYSGRQLKKILKELGKTESGYDQIPLL